MASGMTITKSSTNKRLLGGALFLLVVAVIGLTVAVIILATRSCKVDVSQEIENVCSDDQTVDLAIIGAGIGGSFSAWRLRNNFSKVSLYESSDRIGGRVYTVKLPNGLNVEMGAMRINIDQHHLIVKLLKERNMTTTPFTGLHSPEHALHYIRGIRHRSNESITTSTFPYQVQQDEKNQTFGALIGMLFDRTVDFSAQNSTESFDFITRTGQRLRDVGLWNVYGSSISKEAREFVHDMLPLVGLNNNNAAILFGRQAGPNTLHGIPGGIQPLPESLVQQFMDARETNQFHRNRLLKKIKKEGSSIHLVFHKTESIAGTTLSTQEEENVCAKKVLLAMPPRSLQLVDWAPFKYDHVLKSHLSSHLGFPAFKLFLGFNTPWWRELANTREVFTDLPAKHTMEYFVRPDNSSVLLLYVAGELVPYWKWLLIGRDIFENHIPYNVTQELVEHVYKYAAESMGILREDIPKPTSGVVHVWETDPIGPALYSIMPGFDWRVIQEQMSKPDKDSEVYTATYGKPVDGEWMDGTLNTVEYVLMKHFAMTPFT